jgi:hypothetical protein
MSDFADAFKGADDFFAAFEQRVKTAPVPEPRKCETVQELAGWFVRAGRAAGSIVKRKDT